MTVCWGFPHLRVVTGVWRCLEFEQRCLERHALALLRLEQLS